MNRRLDNKNTKSIAFTLVELLVVIAIVGILSGLIIVGMNTSVNSARIAKSQIFSSSLRDSLLMSLISEWELDEGSGSSVTDSWKGFNGTLTGTYTWVSGSSNCIKNNCLKFDGSTAYATVTNNSSLNIFGPITIEAWVNPAAVSGTYDIVCKGYQSSYAGYEFVINNNTLQFRINPTSATITYRSSPSANLALNVWQHIAVTFDGTNIIFYKDGVSLGSVAASGSLYSSTANLMIGSYASNATFFFNGTMNGLRIYNSSVPSSHFREEYYAGLSNLLTNGGLTLENYTMIIDKFNNKLASHE